MLQLFRGTRLEGWTRIGNCEKKNFGNQGTLETSEITAVSSTLQLFAVTVS